MKVIANGVDTVTPITSATVAAQIKTAGNGFVGRYLIPEKYSHRLTVAETKILTAASLLIASLYELPTSGSRPKRGAAYGKIDGASALACGREMSMPSGKAFYFCADYDAPVSDYNAIEDYLLSTQEQMGDTYKTGLYGKADLIDEMFARGACEYFIQCVAWSNNRISEHANIYQHLWDQTVAGITVDLNYQYSEAGLWNLEDNMVRYERLSDIPNDYGFQDIIGKLMDAEIILGDGSDPAGNEDVINLSYDQVRSLVFEYRGGAFDRKLIAKGMSPAVQT